MDTAKVVDDILAHTGVKGMKWGVRRKATVGAQEVIVSDKRRKIKTKGGKGHPATGEAVTSRTIGQIGKKSGTKALTNSQLKAYNERLNLEQNFKRLQYQDQSRAKRFIKSLIGQKVAQEVSSGGKTLRDPTIRKKMATGAAALAIALP